MYESIHDVHMNTVFDVFCLPFCECFIIQFDVVPSCSFWHFQVIKWKPLPTYYIIYLLYHIYIIGQ